MSSTPIPRQARERTLESRDSVLRASILESALELGVGSSCTVTKWIFNPVEEGDEEAEADTESANSPSLTYASTATSDDSILSNTFSARPQPGAGILLSPVSPEKGAHAAVRSQSPLYPQQEEGRSFGKASSDSSQRIIFDLRATPEPRSVSPLPPSPKSSRFRRLRRNGNESDGGYLSDSGKGKKDKEKEKKKSKKDKSGGNATDYESDGGSFSDAGRKDAKKSKKIKKSKAKDAGPSATDYETDGDGDHTRSKKVQQRSRKGSMMSPSTADESDGGNMSEASSKRRGFFRLNSRSRKKRDSEESPSREIPPVPTLPPAMLPIAERFLRSPTPNMMDDLSRTVTPVSTQASIAEHESVVSFTPTEREERAASTISREGLTKAFRDAHSVHRPSIDALATFANMGPMLTSPTSPKIKPASSPPQMYARPTQPSSPELSDVPTISLPKTKGARPTISAPNTSLLATKHVPAPLVLNSPTSVHSHIAQHYPHTPEDEYILVTPQITPTHVSNSGVTSPPVRSPARPDSEFVIPSPSKQGFPQQINTSASQSSLRPHVLAYYGIPPPTPPPQGPLPEVPALPPGSHLPRSMSADDAAIHGAIPSTRPSASPSPAGPPPTRGLPPTPVSAPMHAVRSASESDVMQSSSSNSSPILSVPLISEPVPRAQRGRVSPFPTSPVKEERGRVSPFPVSPISSSPGLVRKISNLMSPNTSPKVERIARYDTNKPMSADGYTRHNSWRDAGRLDVQWQPRSASALERPRPGVFGPPTVRRKVSFEDETASQDEVSELDMGDDRVDEGEGVEVPEEDVDDVEDDQSVYVSGEDSRPPTMYEASEGGDRSSMWSQSDGRRSFFDEEKSASTRERFVKQVEAMYGEYTVPPVPPLNAPKSRKGNTVG